MKEERKSKRKRKKEHIQSYIISQTFLKTSFYSTIELECIFVSNFSELQNALSPQTK